MKPQMKSLPLLLLSISALAACAQYNEHRDPQLSDMVLDGQTMPEVASVRVPQPAAESPRVPHRAEAASLWRPEAQGFFDDNRASTVGDILTVIIEIDDEAQLKNESKRSRGSENEVDGSTFLGYESKLDEVLPGIDAEDLPTGSLVDLSGSSSSRGSGSIQRNERIRLRVAAIVLQELAGGNLVIAGRQEVRVNSELRELRIAGIIRRVDIDMSNSIPYDRIAEARISYGGKGQLSRVQQPRYGEDALDVVLPY
jgi:flagellar L-ring protein precursor FlgH